MESQERLGVLEKAEQVVRAEKNITLLHAYSPASSSNATLRALGEATSKILGKRFIIEDKPGAGGALAPTIMLKTGKPDGYILSQLPQQNLR